MSKRRKVVIQQISAIVASWEDPAMQVFLFFFLIAPAAMRERPSLFFFSVTFALIWGCDACVFYRCYPFFFFALQKRAFPFITGQWEESLLWRVRVSGVSLFSPSIVTVGNGLATWKLASGMAVRVHSSLSLLCHFRLPLFHTFLLLSALFLCQLRERRECAHIYTHTHLHTCAYW